MEYYIFNENSEEAMKKMLNEPHILIIEYNSHIRDALMYIFKKRGFVVIEAENGLEALKKIEEDKPNVILLDLATPEMDGLDICRRLRANRATQNIPIIFYSAQQSMISDFIRDMPGGPIEYFDKPFEIMRLIRQVQNLLGYN